jgi:hypothetical protein
MLGAENSSSGARFNLFKNNYLKILLFIKYNIIKNKNILDKNKYINNIKYLDLFLAIFYLILFLYYFNSNYFYI